MMNDEQLEKFRAVNTELNTLRDSGALTKSEYDRLRARATEAVGSYTPALEGILMLGVRLGFVAP